MRRKVAAALSHDMRTPLAVIANGAQRIGIAPSIEVARRTASKIESNALRLRDMMAELLDALTCQGHVKVPLHLSTFDVHGLVQEVCDQSGQTLAGVCTFEALGNPVEGYWCRSNLRRAL
nr:histidine kinase dimerization/phospho-acceptor domain-containing protein [Pseudoduganella umbonata]